MHLKINKPRLGRLLNSPGLWILLAVLPAMFLYCNRVLVPDYSTDSLSYHVFNGQRAAHNPLLAFMPTEFYPVGIATIAPGYDLANYLMRSLLGYRLGTLLDLLAAVGCTIILYKLMLLILNEQRKKFHAGWGLLLVNASIVLELYFQLASYLVDVLNTFFVLLVFYWILVGVLKPAKQPPKLLFWTLQWLALGMLLALKLTNIGLVVPLAGLLLWDIYQRRHHIPAKQLVLYAVAVLCFLMPPAPAWVANYRLTHNPLFPYYNSTFKSPYSSSESFRDRTFGGSTPLQKLVWPGSSAFNQTRLAEPHQIYNDYKLVLYWLSALLLLGLALSKRLRLGRAQRVIIYYFLASLLLWGLTFGISRYIIPSLLLGGLIVVILCASIDSWKRRSVRLLWQGLCLVVCLALSVESYRAIHFNMHYDISWRPPLYQNQQLLHTQKSVLFNKSFMLSSSETATVEQADILLNCHTNVAGLLNLLPGVSNKPLVNIIAAELPQYAVMSNDSDYRRVMKERLQTAFPHKTKYTWVAILSDKDIGPTSEDCIANISARSGKLLKTEPIDSLLGYPAIHLVLASGKLSL